MTDEERAECMAMMRERREERERQEREADDGYVSRLDWLLGARDES